jgi:hypothetical protein
VLILLFLPALYATWFRIKPTADISRDIEIKTMQHPAAIAGE